MSLDGVRLNSNNLDQCVEGNVSDVVVTVGQEFAENVYTKHAEARICFDVENGEHCLIEDGVSDVFRRVRVGSDLTMLESLS